MSRFNFDHQKNSVILSDNSPGMYTRIPIFFRVVPQHSFFLAFVTVGSAIFTDERVDLEFVSWRYFVPAMIAGRFVPSVNSSFRLLEACLLWRFREAFLTIGQHVTFELALHRRFLPALIAGKFALVR